MELSRFQIGELFKIFFWIIVVSVPIGLYYIYYSDVQNRYDNQRNFRALNEVSTQLELHLHALEKLFLFTPVNFYLPDEKTEKKLLETYKRRLQVNDFLQDLEVKDISVKKLAKHCEEESVLRFFMDTRATDAHLKVYPCKKVRGETGLKTDEISSCLDKLSPDSEWKCFLDLNKKKQLPWFESVKFVNTEEEKLERLAALRTIYFKLPIKSLLGSNLSLEFDEILLSDNQGDVIFQEGSEILEWSDKKTFLKAARQSNSIININWLLQEASKQVEISNHAKEKVNAATDKENNDTDKPQHIDVLLEHSTYIDLSIAGKDYRIYIHPFVIDNSIYSRDKSSNFNKLYTVGIVEKDRLGGSVFSLPFIYLSVALLLLLLGFLSWPFLRLKFMGIKESISTNDLHVMLLSLLFGLVVVTLFLLTIFTFLELEEELEKQAENIAENIKSDFRHDLTNVLNEMDDHKGVYLKEDQEKITDCQHNDTPNYFWTNVSNFQDVFSCKTSKKEQTSTFPAVRDIFALNNQGDQYGPIIYFVDQLISSNRLKVDFRDYFKNTRDGKTWHIQNKDEKVQPFYIERIHDFSDGSKASQVTMPISATFDESIAEMVENSPVVMASTAYFPSIAAPVLPASFHFAIIENASGDILYHSEDEKSFVENLYAESDYNRHLISHAQMRFNGHIEGLYHGNATKLFVSPLTNMPWSVVVYYDLNRLHVLMAKTAVITLFSFILYLLLVLFLFVLFNKIVSKNWDWLWPHHHKSPQYTELIFMLVLFSISLLLYVMFVSGWFLFWGLILSVPLVLGMVWIFIGDRPYRNKYYHWVFWSCCSILLLSLFPQLNAIQESPGSLSLDNLELGQLMDPIALVLLLVIPLVLLWKKLRQKKYFQFIFWGYSLFLLGLLVLLLDQPFNINHNLWYFQVCATVILIILLVKYIFFAVPPVKNKSYNRLCPENCRVKYLVFITLIYLPIAVIPTIGFFKDTFSVNQVIYSRLDQMHFAENMQKRIHTLDKYARMFYPSVFDKPDNQKRLILGGPENNKFSYSLDSESTENTFGIYGFKRNLFQIDDTDYPVSPNSQGGPADVFLEILLNINLRFAQQHVVNTDNLNNDGRYWKGQLLNFTTEDSAGVMRHQITQQAPGLGSVILSNPGFWSVIQLNSGLWSVIQSTLQPGFLLFLIVFGWCLLLSYFSRRVFAIYIPEPMPCRNSSSDQQVDLDLYPFNILIRGVDNKFLFLLQNSGVTVNPAKDIHYLDILTADFDDSQVYKKILIVDNLDAGIQDPIRRKQALEYMEKQINRQSGQCDFIFLRCEIAPLYRLTNPSAYPYVDTTQDATSLQPDIEEINRWSKLLAKFKKYYCWELPLENTDTFDVTPADLSEQQKQLIRLVRVECRIWPELDPIEQELELIIREDSSGLLNKQQVLEYIRTHGNVFFRKRWELCTRDERLCLCQLARGQFINSANEVVIEHLYRRGYIKRAPYFRIASETFKNFVGTAELIENPVTWETEACKSVWSRLKIPLFIILFCLTGVLLYVASDALDVTLGLLSGLLAFIPLLLRGVNNMKGDSS